jgi:hypothetical protein
MESNCMESSCFETNSNKPLADYSTTTDQNWLLFSLSIGIIKREIMSHW